MPYAIDLFCGAGGFSEGILQAGFDIIFSSDRSPMVQETYVNRHEQLGLAQGVDTWFELADIKELTADFIFDKINSLKYGRIFSPGTVDVMFGGPPCQGFSRLGKRDAGDPRNMLFHEYLRLIRDIGPKYVVMENVTGILDMQMLDFPSVLEEEKVYKGQSLVPQILTCELEGLGYEVLDFKSLNAADFGVPQQRNRVIFLAHRRDVYPISYPKEDRGTVSVYDALGDLYGGKKQYTTAFSRDAVKGRTRSRRTNAPIARTEITNSEQSSHNLPVTQRFQLYQVGENTRNVLSRLRRDGIDLRGKFPELFCECLFQMNVKKNIEEIKKCLVSLSFCQDKELSGKWYGYTNKQLSVIYTFKKVRRSDKEAEKAMAALARRLGVGKEGAKQFWDMIEGKLNGSVSGDCLNRMFVRGDITSELAEALFTKKDIRARLNPQGVSPTMVTLPDDFIHPYFDRILTVREMARLQSFDDSFTFLGKRTTGGDKRAVETPQFTQVGNAVPPLLARAIAKAAYEACEKDGEGKH